MSNEVMTVGAQSGTVVPRGNAATMYEALVRVKCLFDGRLMWQPDIRKAHEAVDAALSAPPRNCDVGTAEGQYARVRAFCKRHKVGLRCVDCPVNGMLPKNCALIWSQMPYEEGGVK